MKLSSHFSEKLQKHIALIFALSVLWIYVGNIINFHQHHIWGKQLIPVACTSNRSKEKSFDHPGNLLKSHYQSGFICQESIQADSQITFINSVMSAIFMVDVPETIASVSLLAHSLRGPPTI